MMAKTMSRVLVCVLGMVVGAEAGWVNIGDDVYIQGPGTVGIGMRSGGERLYLADNSDGAAVFLDQNGTGWGLRVAIEGSGYTPIFRAEAPQNHCVMTVNANGNVGIGVMDPSERLSVDGEVTASASFLRGSSGTLAKPLPWEGGSTIQGECEARRPGSRQPGGPLFVTLARSYGYLAGVSGPEFLTEGIGVYGEVTSGRGKGVHGRAAVESGTGVYGEVVGHEGIGVHGVATAGGYGVKGEAMDGGYGVRGEALNGGHGVYGVTQGGRLDTAPHFAGYFEGKGEYSSGVFGKGGGPRAMAAWFEGPGYFSGNVGIGTANPGAQLHVNGQIKIAGGSPGAGKVLTSDATGLASWQVSSSGSDKDWQVVGRNMYSIPSGCVGIGTENPSFHKLVVNGSAAKPGGGFWSSYSDERLKRLGGNYECGLSEVRKLNPVRYNYKEDNELELPTEQEHIGLIAQEVQTAIPEAVQESIAGYLMVNNAPIMCAMVNAIKELERQNLELARQNDVLVRRLEVLEDRVGRRPSTALKEGK